MIRWINLIYQPKYFPFDLKKLCFSTVHNRKWSIVVVQFIISLASQWGIIKFREIKIDYKYWKSKSSINIGVSKRKLPCIGK